MLTYHTHFLLRGYTGPETHTLFSYFRATQQTWLTHVVPAGMFTHRHNEKHPDTPGHMCVAGYRPNACTENGGTKQKQRVYSYVPCEYRKASSRTGHLFDHRDREREIYIYAFIYIYVSIYI